MDSKKIAENTLRNQVEVIVETLRDRRTALRLLQECLNSGCSVPGLRHELYVIPHPAIRRLCGYSPARNRLRHEE